jgi:membrane-associated phospholipid phosphatase
MQSINLDSPEARRPSGEPVGEAPGAWAVRGLDWRHAARAAPWPQLAVVLLATAIPLIIMEAVGHPRIRPFAGGDATLSYPYRPNSVPAWAAVVGPLLAWAATAVAVEGCVRKRVNGCATQAAAAVLYHSVDVACAILVTTLATEATKLAVGYPRPYFLAACAPADGSTVPAAGAACSPTGVVKTLDSARVSFPSGHASSSACIATFTAAYALWAALVTPAPRRAGAWGGGYKAAAAADGARSASLAWALLVLVMPWAIAASRIVDNRHHPADVVAGLLLGGVVALLFFARSLAGRLALPRYDAKARAPVFESGGGEGAGLTEARV